jgi:anti-anti-sigma factor
VLWASGELDVKRKPVVVDAATAALTAASTVVSDLSQVTFLDSSGLHALVMCHQVAQRSPGQFSVRGALGKMAAVLGWTGVGELLSTPDM